jgi:hypothetical protein
VHEQRKKRKIMQRLRNKINIMASKAIKDMVLKKVQMRFEPG